MLLTQIEGSGGGKSLETLVGHLYTNNNPCGKNNFSKFGQESGKKCYFV